MSFPAQTSRLPDGTVRISIHGEIDLDNAYHLRDAVDAALTAGKPPKIVFDLREAVLVDSVAIGILVSCYHAAAACGVPLTAADPSPVVYRQLWVCGLAGLFGLPTPAEQDGAPFPAGEG
jgi:anti-anti-sigma factor